MHCICSQGSWIVQVEGTLGVQTTLEGGRSTLVVLRGYWKLEFTRKIIPTLTLGMEGMNLDCKIFLIILEHISNQTIYAKMGASYANPYHGDANMLWMNKFATTGQGDAGSSDNVSRGQQFVEQYNFLSNSFSL
ncbi:hypothetical protein RHGRI_005247 [Rhododendron griersonianum]|uniref:Uncharacterized protein n=1 Tax=Rhododendron griersonianum TaxID=479676 RepID=A0AAV6LBJ0_9ERIC|nr:hypothetical protein RHGRI_005247 [Rhododendron griersonianum]